MPNKPLWVANNTSLSSKKNLLTILDNFGREIQISQNAQFPLKVAQSAPKSKNSHIYQK